jgi:F0F1-type ATP synthase alpha subunit
VRFQDELRESLRAEGSVYQTIRETGDISEETEEKLKTEIEKFKQRFQPTEQEAV